MDTILLIVGVALTLSAGLVLLMVLCKPRNKRF